MNASSSPALAERYVDVLEGFGLSRTDLDEPHESEGPLTPETVRWDLELDDPDGAYACLQQALARSRRGIEAPRRYWSQAPAFQLNDVLEPYGYEVSFEAPGGGEFGAVEDRFDVDLADGETTERMTFVYPDGPYGDDNYPALAHAVERRLLPGEDLRFVLLEGHEDAWRFVLVERDDLSTVREAFGPRVEVFGRPLLAGDQPADYVDDVGGTDPSDPVEGPGAGLVGGFDSVVAASGIDDVFESIEREVATEPVVPGAESGPEVGEEVHEIITSVGGAATGPELRDDHIPSPASREDRPAGLSRQVAKALYSEGDDHEDDGSRSTDAGPRTNGDGADASHDADAESEAGFVPAVGEGSWNGTDGDSDPRDGPGTADGRPSGGNAGDDAERDARRVRGQPVDPRSIGEVDAPANEDDGDDDERGRIGRLTDTVRNLI